MSHNRKMNSPEENGLMFRPRNIVGNEIITMLASKEDIITPKVVLVRTVYLYCIIGKYDLNIKTFIDYTKKVVLFIMKNNALLLPCSKFIILSIIIGYAY